MQAQIHTCCGLRSADVHGVELTVAGQFLVEAEQNGFCDLARLLRHVASSDVLITQGPRQVQAPLELGAEEVESACDISKNCYIGYSGTSFGSPRYFPKSNKGYFTLSLNILGPSKRRVDLAENNLRATENTKLDKTGMQRRTEFLRRWRILWVAEDKCLPDIKG